MRKRLLGRTGRKGFGQMADVQAWQRLIKDEPSEIRVFNVQFKIICANFIQRFLKHSVTDGNHEKWTGEPKWRINQRGVIRYKDYKRSEQESSVPGIVGNRKDTRLLSAHRIGSELFYLHIRGKGDFRSQMDLDISINDHLLLTSLNSSLFSS